MKVQIKDKFVDVLDNICRERKCFCLFPDKGIFKTGREYISYRKKPKWVCGTRYLQGCPDVYYCRQCKTTHPEKTYKCICGNVFLFAL
jgi:hypothetical protein